MVSLVSIYCLYSCVDTLKQSLIFGYSWNFFDCKSYLTYTLLAEPPSLSPAGNAFSAGGSEGGSASRVYLTPHRVSGGFLWLLPLYKTQEIREI